MRGYKFTAFDAREELQPTQPQLQAAESLVDALDLAQGLCCNSLYCAIYSCLCEIWLLVFDSTGSNSKDVLSAMLNAPSVW